MVSGVLTRHPVEMATVILIHISASAPDRVGADFPRLNHLLWLNATALIRQQKNVKIFLPEDAVALTMISKRTIAYAKNQMMMTAYVVESAGIREHAITRRVHVNHAYAICARGKAATENVAPDAADVRTVVANTVLVSAVMKMDATVEYASVAMSVLNAASVSAVTPDPVDATV